jgi:hypothetical protein
MGEHAGRMMAGVMPFRAPLMATMPVFVSQKAFTDPVGVVPKRGGARTCRPMLRERRSVSEYRGS